MKSKNLLEESIKLQLEAKAIGLDWIELDKIIDKIREETNELDEAIDSNDHEHIIEEFGDLFFSLISLSRHLNIDMDDLNKSANDKFKNRLDKIKNEMKKRNIKYAEPSEMIEIWKSIKNKS
jgi:phosphoribosyl-ATP pyrophosphohydrolase|tara:strand:+ start:239 stop:604 length:366 start_codon:yes stop_codon:yes gene_type:complete